MAEDDSPGDIFHVAEVPEHCMVLNWKKQLGEMENDLLSYDPVYETFLLKVKQTDHWSAACGMRDNRDLFPFHPDANAPIVQKIGEFIVPRLKYVTARLNYAINEIDDFREPDKTHLTEYVDRFKTSIKEIEQESLPE